MSTEGVEVTAVSLLKPLDVTTQAHLKVLRSDCTGTSNEISFRPRCTADAAQLMYYAL